MSNFREVGIFANLRKNLSFFEFLEKNRDSLVFCSTSGFRGKIRIFPRFKELVISTLGLGSFFDSEKIQDFLSSVRRDGHAWFQDEKMRFFLEF